MHHLVSRDLPFEREGFRLWKLSSSVDVADVNEAVKHGIKDFIAKSATTATSKATDEGAGDLPNNVKNDEKDEKPKNEGTVEQNANIFIRAVSLNPIGGDSSV